MRWVKFFAVAIAVFLSSLYLWAKRNLDFETLKGGEVVIGIAIVAVLVALAIHVHKNRRAISDLAEGDYGALKTLLFRRKKLSKAKSSEEDR